MKILLTLFLIFNAINYTFCQKLIVGKVIRVADGDTFTILDSTNTQIKVRFHGIDCPEKGQDYYQVAKDFTNNRSYGIIVKIEDLGKDRYGRTIGKVRINDSTMLNLELIKSGLAWHYTYFDKSKEFEDAEKSAKEKKLNIWSMPNAIAPWDFRKIN